MESKRLIVLEAYQAYSNDPVLYIKSNYNISYELPVSFLA